MHICPDEIIALMTLLSGSAWSFLRIRARLRATRQSLVSRWCRWFGHRMRVRTLVQFGRWQYLVLVCSRRACRHQRFLAALYPTTCDSIVEFGTVEEWRAFITRLHGKEVHV